MYVSLHNHTAIGSNTRGFLDSINTVEKMVAYAKELNHTGLCITDHDSLTAHIDLLHHIKSLREKDPEKWKDFKPICGNEIYLTSKKNILEDKDYSKLYHFILIAKDEIGYDQLRKLSTRAWCDNSFTFVNIRTPTYFDDLTEVVRDEKGHLIGQTACLRGQCDRMIVEAYNLDQENPDYSLVEKWLRAMDKLFGHGNFFLEMQPSNQEAQILVNKVILELSSKLDIPYVITTDAHYLKKEDREIHEAFLKSDDNGDSREVGEFYNTTYMMSEEEIHSYMDEYLTPEQVQVGIDNTQLVYNLCEEYSLDKPLVIPYKAFDTTEPSPELYAKYKDKVPLLEYFYNSEHDSNRHMCREILNKFEERPEEFQNQKTYDALKDCLNAIIVSSKAQNTEWAGYLLVCKELIKTVWEAGSLCGVGRGSGGGFFLLYMLEIIGFNPLREEVKTFYWRFLHEKRASVLD